MDINNIKEIFNDVDISSDKIIVKNDVLKIIECVKDTYKFDLLKEIIAVDNGEFGVELIYNLYSTENEEDLKISVTVKDSAESVSSIFDSAVADENEIYDLFGINFIGNKELKRLYMPENWKGHPLKKNYENKDERLGWNE